MKLENLPKKIPVFPLSNFIIFPKTTVPLNIFEPRYIDMINDSMKADKIIGMIQPKSFSKNENIPELHDVGCIGKIISFRETEDRRYLIELKGLMRFQSVKEVQTNKKYRMLEVNYENFSNDLNDEKENLQVLSERAVLVYSYSNLLTYPWIHDAVNKKSLDINAWWLDFKSVRLWKKSQGIDTFIPIEF